MSKSRILLICYLILLIILVGCSMRWTEAIQMGGISQQEFEEVVDIEVTRGLIIVPVIINGETYRFLFDSGAPFSISEKRILIKEE